MAGVATAAYSTDLSSGGVDGSQWDYAVPLGGEEPSHASKSRTSHDSTNVRARSSKKRNSINSRSSSVSRNAGRGRRDPSLNRYGSEVLSMQDTFGHDGTRDFVVSKDGTRIYQEDIDQENWIHRDKLAKIESEELQQAAFLFQRRTRADTRSSAGRGRAHDSNQEQPSEPWPEVREENDGGDGADIDDERKHWDLRRPEEIAAEEAASSIYSNPTLRKSSSRIPISTASPSSLVPSRSRAATDENDEEASRGRRASGPITVETETTTPSPVSRPGSRGATATPTTPAKKTPGKVITGSANRKTSAPPTNRKNTNSNNTRSRATSGNNTTQRPTTRSGESRPTTGVNRPEGDPPWLATMYKPDPRLPPDQQMLPTLARKMQQEQWEKEGRTPTTYDRDFAPLAVRPNDEPPVVPAKEEKPAADLEPPRKDEALKPPTSPEPARPNTSTGYSTMPKVASTPPLGFAYNPNWNPPVVTADESKKKEKGCGCCIVM
ncbi:uncharacterized protein PFLUO_LOCUS1591 [Penicillium psychrofluorescens]|uniref:uncharacterized protein n=1 Tax=Penicillium psychrofluorescens TaxID=3158075 RepID=UPI003CCD4FB8